MGILDTIQALAGQAGQAAGTDQAKVAGGFIEALTQHPEGIQGLLNSFKQNGMAEHVGAWSTGQAATATPEQVQQGLGATTLENIAQRAGISPTVASGVIAVVLPLVVSHFSNGGQQPGGIAGLASQLFGSKS